jgi:hypothetical protein
MKKRGDKPLLSFYFKYCNNLQLSVYYNYVGGVYMKVDMKTVRILREITGLNLDDCLTALKQADNNIDIAIQILNDKKILSDDKFKNITSDRNSQSTNEIHCPKCNSTQIQLQKRGWKITTGFLGSSKDYRVCMNCLHKW